MCFSIEGFGEEQYLRSVEFGYQPLVGYNHGANDEARVREATRTMLVWASIYSVAVGIVFALLAPQLIGFFSDDASVIGLGSTVLIINAFTFMTMGVQMVISHQFMGLGAAKEGGLVSLGRQGFFFIPFITILPMIFGLAGIVAAQPIADILSFALVIVLARRQRIHDAAIVKGAKA